MLKVVQLKDKALLRSFGVHDSWGEESDSGSETDPECEEAPPGADKSMTADKDNTNQTSSKNMDGAQEGSAGCSVEETSVLPHQFQLPDYLNSDETMKLTNM